jgi:hypothetical protein
MGCNVQFFPSAQVTVNSNAPNASEIHFMSAMFVQGTVKGELDRHTKFMATSKAVG